MKHILFSITFIGMLIGSGTLRAQVLAGASATASATAPEGPLLVAAPLSPAVTTPGTITSYYRGEPPATGAVRRSVGDAFKAPESGAATGITWQLVGAAPETLGKNFSISLYEVGGLTASYAPNADNLLARWSGTLPESLAVEETPYVGFQFDQSYLLEEGKYYAFVFGLDEPTSSTSSVHHFTFLTSGNQNESILTPNPRHWRDTDGVWSTTNSSKMVFFVHTIPEPSAALLFGGAAFVLFLCRLPFLRS